MELIIVRHGETEWTISGQHTGVTDLPLTSNGRRQAAQLPPAGARVLDGHTPVVYTSPRRRAIDTAKRAFPQRFASDTASITVIGDHHGKRYVRLWNMTVDPADISNRTQPNE